MGLSRDMLDKAFRDFKPLGTLDLPGLLHFEATAAAAVDLPTCLEHNSSTRLASERSNCSCQGSGTRPERRRIWAGSWRMGSRSEDGWRAKTRFSSRSSFFLNAWVRRRDME